MNARRLLPLFAGLMMASNALAQPAPGGPPGGPDGDRPPPPRMRDDHDRRDGPGRDGPGRDGPGRDGGGPRPAPFDTMRGYLDLVERYSRLSRDPSASGVAAVITTADILRPRGHQVVIDTFEKMLPEVKNDAVARALRLQLADLYRQSNQPEKALATLTDLIKSAPAGTPPVSPGGH